MKSDDVKDDMKRRGNSRPLNQYKYNLPQVALRRAPEELVDLLLQRLVIELDASELPGEQNALAPLPDAVHCASRSGGNIRPRNALGKCENSTRLSRTRYCWMSGIDIALQL